MCSSKSDKDKVVVEGQMISKKRIRGISMEGQMIFKNKNLWNIYSDPIIHPCSLEPTTTIMFSIRLLY